jgi:hypothetical protein
MRRRTGSRRRVAIVVVLGWVVLGTGAAAARAAVGSYPQAVLSSPEVRAYWRLGEASGAAAADASGHVAGSYVGGVGLGARGALSGDSDTAGHFDGVDDELQGGDGSLALAGAGTLEGWFFWEAGVALARDSTTSAGWILAYDSGGRIAYRAGGTAFTTPLATAQLRDGWHHVALAAGGGATAFYVDGALVHAGTGAGNAAAVMPWRVMHNGAMTGQFTRGRADDVAVYATPLDASTVRAHFEAGRDISDTTSPAPPGGLSASAGLGRVVLDWTDSAEPDLDGYDVFRGAGAGGPFTRVNASRLSGSTYTDAAVTGGAGYFYVVTASDVANHRSGFSAAVAATPPSTDDLLRSYAPELRYESQESYFADSAAEMTDNFVSGSRQNYLVGSGGARLAAANPADPLPNLSLGLLGDPLYADGRPSGTGDYLDAANSTYQQDAQRMRAAGYRDRIYGRAVTSGGRIWLQYWLFYYYNPQNVLGFGVHEGDWEFAQLGLDADGVPEVATYAQHGDGERCAWSQVRKSGGGAPVVYVALASHASYFAVGVNGRGFYPDDYHRGGGYTVRPSVEVVTPTTPFMAWRGRWGASSSSPIAPRRQGSWLDPAGFHATGKACTVAAAAAAERRGARVTRSPVRAPRIAARRAGGHAVVDYRVRVGRARPAVRPVTLLVSVSSVAAPDVTTARRVRARGSAGRIRLALPPNTAQSFEVRASTFSRDGTRSRIVTTPLR